MARNPAKIECLKADSVLDNAVLGEFDSKLFLSHSNRLPVEEEIPIIRHQLEEDQRELDAITARIDIEESKIREKSRSLTETRSEIEAYKKQLAETTGRLRTELDAQNSFERLSREYTNSISLSESADKLMSIHSDFAEKSQYILRHSRCQLQRTQQREAGAISQLERTLKISSSCLDLFLDRKRSLEAHRETIIASIARKQALMGWTRRLPTETLVQVFLTTLELFIHDRIQDYSTLRRHPILAIASVCRRWREIAMATAELWKYIPIYGIPSNAKKLPPSQTKMLNERVSQSTDLFIDCNWAKDGQFEMDSSGHMRAMDYFGNMRAPNEQLEDQMPLWGNLLWHVARSVDLDSKRKSHRNITLHFSNKAPVTLDIRFFPLEAYTFYNIYPTVLTVARDVTSIAMYFNQRPRKQPLTDILQQFPNLINFEVHLLKSPYLATYYEFAHSSCPSLQSLSVRLSLLPYFLSDRHSVSRKISSLRIHCDQPSYNTLITLEQWAATVKLAKLGTGLRYLGLDGVMSTNDATSHAVPLLRGLRSVTTLALCGYFLTPVLDALSQEPSLLPILFRLEMRSTDVDESVIETLLRSRRSSPQSDSVPIRELVLDHCSSIARDFCDRISGGVKKLTVYC